MTSKRYLPGWTGIGGLPRSWSLGVLSSGETLWGGSTPGSKSIRDSRWLGRVLASVVMLGSKYRFEGWPETEVWAVGVAMYATLGEWMSISRFISADDCGVAQKQSWQNNTIVRLCLDMDANKYVPFRPGKVCTTWKHCYIGRRCETGAQQVQQCISSRYRWTKRVFNWLKTEHVQEVNCEFFSLSWGVHIFRGQSFRGLLEISTICINSSIGFHGWGGTVHI